MTQAQRIGAVDAWGSDEARGSFAVVMVGQNRMLMRVCRGWWSDEPLTQVTKCLHRRGRHRLRVQPHPVGRRGTGGFGPLFLPG